MSKYRDRLPLLEDRPFMTDGGLETSLIFHHGIELPHFASYDLLKTEGGSALIERHYERFTILARKHEVGIVLATPTWRASRDWGRKLGYSDIALADANRRAVDQLAKFRCKWESPTTPIVIVGTIGPRGDGYQVDLRMNADEAQDYHKEQINSLAATQVDMVGGFTLNYIDEAIGMVRAAKAAEVPISISFTLETDGRLHSGDTLQRAVERTDAATAGYASFFMINCAHPSHFERTLQSGGDWLQRIRGVRANASRRSHAELDEAEELDDGNPLEFGQETAALRRFLRRFNIAGGCCGTDHRHADELWKAIKRGNAKPAQQ
ncbi:homocysteine S-methyltransferase family protein [Paraburkholderia strydomiana]|uniref:homocysteine S-methyltransferase family protein n=1 Tax=Paraburkholderia strydomiana TaxID=1245417 RepID=UPI00285428BC|nr:homocysteine S-methyltransferase family protein [Paraburkholderia strydomiana]MDR7008892.1 S-methylmethionine-dependent homocysteine/selenocysteine methylase [Paraburkholderia strydomiana]